MLLLKCTLVWRINFGQISIYFFGLDYGWFIPGLNVNNLFILTSVIAELHLSAPCAPVINLILEQYTIPTQAREQSLLILERPQLNHRLSVDYV